MYYLKKVREIKSFIVKLGAFVGIFSFIVSAGFSFNKYVIERDYFVMAKVKCTDFNLNCFADESQEIDQNIDFFGYKYVYKKAYSIPECNPYSTCTEIKCNHDDPEYLCFEKYCNPDDPESVCVK